jgi:hypothetical protein
MEASFCAIQSTYARPPPVAPTGADPRLGSSRETLARGRAPLLEERRPSSLARNVEAKPGETIERNGTTSHCDRTSAMSSQFLGASTRHRPPVGAADTVVVDLKVELSAGLATAGLPTYMQHKTASSKNTTIWPVSKLVYTCSGLSQVCSGRHVVLDPHMVIQSKSLQSVLHTKSLSA